MILWKLYKLIKGLSPATKCLIFDAIKAIRQGEKKKAGLKAREAAEREALYKWGRSYLKGNDK